MRLRALAVILLLVPAASQDRDRKIQDRVDALRPQVEAALGVRFKSKVSAASQSRVDFEKWLRERMKKDYPRERVEGLTQLWKSLGLVPEGFDLVKTLTGIISGLASAYYDFDTKKLYVIAGALPDAELETALYHEMIHAAQDQEHDLSKFWRGGNNEDRLHAFRFLIEGEAMFWERVFAVRKQGKDYDTLPAEVRAQMFAGYRDLSTPQLLKLMAQNAAHGADEIRKAPGILARTLCDPYLRGMNAAFRIHAEKGREGFRELFRKGLTSRDMMFADEALKSPRGPAEVKLAPLQDLLGKEWKKVHEDTIGAVTLHTLFESDKAGADAIGEAWEGDRVEVWRKGGEVVAVGRIAFVAPDAAWTFEELMKQRGFEAEARNTTVVFLCGKADFLKITTALWKP